MKLIELLNGVKYELLKGTLDKKISHLQYDSRKIIEDDIFVCLKGFEVDGHNYANKAIELGAKVIICERDIEVNKDDVTVIKVKEGRKALSIMSANYYDNPSKNLSL